MAGQVINRREQHKQHTRAALEQAALDLFARVGFEDTTVEEIAATAGVSVRTFFRYYASKQHVLFTDAVHRRIEMLGQSLRARPADEPALDSIRIVLETSDITDLAELSQLRVRTRLLTAQPSMVKIYLQINNELRHQICDFVASRYGLPLTDPYPLLVSAAAVAAWDTAVLAFAAGRDDLTALRREAFAQLTEGIPRQPAGM